MERLQRPTPAPYPETILQFGTGRFLRAFADFFVHRGQSKGIYRGSICAVQSTGRGRAETLNQQGGYYTLWVRDSGRDSTEVMGALSRVLAAQDAWSEVVQLSRSETLQAVLSNTTEIGLTLDVDDDIMLDPPRSFPGKLTRVLYERGRHFQYHADRGLVILPCELVDSNGDRLRDLVLTVARKTGLPPRFLRWIESHNTFCNTLVDRIVPGTAPESEHRAMEERLGYRDPMMITAETYRLWAIEGPPELRQRVGFIDADPGIILTQDITPYRLRKVRLLNGGHTLSVPLGLLAGNRTVMDNMTHTETAPYIENLLRKEIGPTLEVNPTTVAPYIDEVLKRWRNPFLEHRLIDITLQSTTKMLHRVVPSVCSYYAQHGSVPQRMALGFAAYLLFMQGQHTQDGIIHTLWKRECHPVHDDKAPYLRDLWQQHSRLSDLVTAVCRDRKLWGTDLSTLPGWTSAVTAFIEQILDHGVAAAIGHIEVASS